MAKTITISGKENDKRIESRVLEERIQQAVADGARDITIEAFGQHGLGGRLWISKEEPINVTITGSPGQRTGSMGFPNTRIVIDGPGSDDIGWLNAGAEIVVRGNVSNGACNAMAQGKVYVGGNTGSRCMTMTKRNPRFDPPELWVLGSVGDYFAEFMAGGVAVVCGVESVAQNPANVLGYRPCVGMVGGRIYFRGPIEGYSVGDAKLVPLEDDAWAWLETNLKTYLEAIGRADLIDELSERTAWQCIEARSPMERSGRKRRDMKQFHNEVWDAELGKGGLIGDLADIDRTPIPLITQGELRRYMPVWENRKYASPCQVSCPTGIPVQERWGLIREGLMDEAVDLALAYTPFPAAVCGYLCPNLCMQGCTRNTVKMPPVDVSMLGKASLKSKTPELPALSGHRVAVVGGGPAGLSVAWQLRLQGHEAVVYDMSAKLGGKLSSAIPEERIPADVLDTELGRIGEVLPHVHLQQKLSKKEFEKLQDDFDYVIVATGASKPRVLPIPGKEHLVPALTFLQEAKAGTGTVGDTVVIIGAGNVGCDVATEAARLGAKDITLIDIQEPASFGKERDAAEEAGAKFRWPCFTKEITDKGVVLTDGELIEADTVLVSIGDAPELDFLTDDIATDRGFVVVSDIYQTSNPKVFAIGDVVRPGLLTDAIGMGRIAALSIDDIFQGKRPAAPHLVMVDTDRITLEYFDPRLTEYTDVKDCADQCSSCGSCRDCGLCEAVCPRRAISRIDRGGKDFEMVVDAAKCIGCGFCAGCCPCGIWNMMENAPLE